MQRSSTKRPSKATASTSKSNSQIKVNLKSKLKRKLPHSTTKRSLQTTSIQHKSILHSIHNNANSSQFRHQTLTTPTITTSSPLSSSLLSHNKRSMAIQRAKNNGIESVGALYEYQKTMITDHPEHDKQRLQRIKNTAEDLKAQLARAQRELEEKLGLANRKPQPDEGTVRRIYFLLLILMENDPKLAQTFQYILTTDESTASIGSRYQHIQSVLSDVTEQIIMKYEHGEELIFENNNVHQMALSNFPALYLLYSAMGSSTEPMLLEGGPQLGPISLEVVNKFQNRLDYTDLTSAHWKALMKACFDLSPDEVTQLESGISFDVHKALDYYFQQYKYIQQPHIQEDIINALPIPIPNQRTATSDEMVQFKALHRTIALDKVSSHITQNGGLLEQFGFTNDNIGFFLLQKQLEHYFIYPDVQQAITLFETELDKICPIYVSKDQVNETLHQTRITSLQQRYPEQKIHIEAYINSKEYQEQVQREKRLQNGFIEGKMKQNIPRREGVVINTAEMKAEKEQERQEQMKLLQQLNNAQREQSLSSPSPFANFVKHGKKTSLLRPSTTSSSSSSSSSSSTTTSTSQAYNDIFGNHNNNNQQQQQIDQYNDNDEYDDAPPMKRIPIRQVSQKFREQQQEELLKQQQQQQQPGSINMNQRLIKPSLNMQHFTQNESINMNQQKSSSKAQFQNFKDSFGQQQSSSPPQHNSQQYRQMSQQKQQKQQQQQQQQSPLQQKQQQPGTTRLAFANAARAPVKK